MEEADALEALSNILTLLTEDPYDITLHAQHVRLARAPGMEDQLELALDMVTSFWAAGDYVWLPLSDIKMKELDLDKVEDVQTLLALFERAEDDYLSIPLLKKHLEFVIERHKHYLEDGTKPDDFGELFTTEWVLAETDSIVSRGIWHLTESQQLWELQREHITDLLEGAAEQDKPALTEVLETILKSRLKQPHSNQEETFQAYSSFTTNYKPADQYENLLVTASKLRGQAVKAYQRREKNEIALANAKFSLDGYAYYIAGERRTKKPDMLVLPTLYERAIAEADKRRWEGEAGAEEALRMFWLGYLDLMKTGEPENEALLELLKRATRSAPGSGEVWARYLRFLERTAAEVTDAEEQIAGVYEKAMSISALTKNVEEVVPVVLARAGYEKRRIEVADGGEERDFSPVLSVLMEGIGKVRKASEQGDPRLRLEKFFSSLCTEVVEMIEHAVIMWEDATKFYKASYLVWTAYTDLLIRSGLHDDVRKVFRDVANKNLDWPEAIWESWVAFEQLHGTVEQLEDCLARIDRARLQVNAKRAKDAEKAAYESMQVAAERQAANVPVEQAPMPSVAQSAGAGELVAMEVDVVIGEAIASTKRKAEDEEQAEGSKKARTELRPPPLKRDRENSTVFVADLPSNATEDDLKALFKDCGPIREVKMTQLLNMLVATIEFMDRESVPAALTKDKKRINDEEIAVHLAWKSTLYVTNFPENADDAFVRDLFGKYGTLFDVRWPSKKFKNTRRFCYIQFTSPDSAAAALDLHGRELAPGLPLSVYFSNPERKKERTDVGADEREVYVAGISRLVTKDELQTLFGTYGKVKEVRMALDDKGQPKGFAFVEFAEERDALAALSANNHELKKRRIAVTLADTRRAKRGNASARPGEVETRSVRIRGLPPNTQEGLLQQALEKLARVKRVEVFLDKNEAVAEFESPADASKLLLHPDPIVYQESTLQLSEESLEAASGRANAPSAPAGGLFIPRTTVSRPRAGLGSKKARATVAHSTVAPTDASSSGSTGAGRASSASASGAKGQDDFRKMLSGS